ncbi:MAG: DUF4038 domain-containing protein, partial [Acidobacteria bacterium]|nr:DUF4038 domain-containing protein [Acidobacteriota bacterium]
MKPITTALLILVASTAGLAQPAFPLKVSGNGHHLVDQNGKPFLLHGDSPWESIWRLTREEMIQYLDRRAEQGFNSILVNLIPDSLDDGHPRTTNRYGVMPFRDPNDFSTANAAYFDHAEWVVSEANKRRLLVLMFPCYLGISHTWMDELHKNGVAGARAYGKFVAERFREYPNLIWIMGGDIDPEFAQAEHDALAESLHEHDPGRLITFHGREHSSATLYHNAKWLGLNMTYTYGDTYVQSHEDWRRTPVKPTILSESGYERESNDRRYGTPLRMRRQAYWTLLAGSCGHLYGSFYWHLKPGWRESLEWPGALHMKHVRDFFEALPWTEMVPEFEKQLILDGQGEYGSTDDYITAASTPDRRVAALYMPVPRRLKLDMALFPGPVRARWFDPTTGVYSNAAAQPLANQGEHWLIPPPRESDGDWALVLESQSSSHPRPSLLTKYFELRIHHVLPGKTAAVLERFRGKIGELKKRHGLNPVACWVMKDPKQGEKVVELFAPESREAAERGWKTFNADADFQTAYKSSEAKHGRTFERVEHLKLVAPAS